MSIVAGDERWEVVTGTPGLTIAAARRRGRALTVAVRQRGSLAESPPATVLVPATGDGT